MQSVSSRIWTRIAVFISYGDNDYATGPQEYTAYESVFTSPAVPHMFGSSNLDSFRDGW